MKRTKLLLVALFATLAVNLSAMDVKSDYWAYEMAKSKTEVMKENFNLTPNQITDIEKINLISAQMQIEQLRLKKNICTTEECNSKVKDMLKAISNQQDALIKLVLTKDQYEQYAIWSGYAI